MRAPRPHLTRKSAPTAQPLVSIGYERRKLADLLTILQESAVSCLLDVREFAMSRRPDFRKGSLSRAVAEIGVEYIHLPAAGNPYRKERDNIAACLRAYRTHLNRHLHVLTDIRDVLGRHDVVAFLCYERDHDLCHRSVLLDALTSNRRPQTVIRVS